MSRVAGEFRKSRCAQACLTAALLFPGALGSSPQTADPTPKARFTSYEEAQATVRRYNPAGLQPNTTGVEARWDHWIRAQDAEVRSRVERGVEDSISNFILYGVSFTKLPRLSGSEEALDQHGSITGTAEARVHALAAALERGPRNERLQFIRKFLARRGVPPSDFDSYLAGNLIRFAQEQQTYQKALDETGKSDAEEVMSVRGSLYKERGLSADTSLLPNFAIEETLRALTSKGVLKPGSIRRIAVVGPGLDFADKREGYDFYPLQTLQPFAVLEAVIRLGIAGDRPLQVITLDLNDAVNAHVAGLSSRGRKGQPYTIQLPRDTRAGWSDPATEYWKQFGTILGVGTKPLPVPDALPSLESRAVSIRPEYSASMAAIDLNIVAQTADLADGDGFDLVVATNILVYYDLFQQALAMGNIAHTMTVGGIFLANNALPAEHDPRLKFLGRKHVPFAKDGSYGDDVFAYRRQ